MSLAKKLNLKGAMRLRVLGKPVDVDLGDVAMTEEEDADGVLVFFLDRASVDAEGGPLLEAAKAGRLAWAAYPKAGQLDTDLNRDVLWKHLQKQGIDPVRQVAIDDVWSAMRFRTPKES